MASTQPPQFPRRKGLLDHSINQSYSPYTFILDFNLKLHMPSIPSNSSTNYCSPNDPPNSNTHSLSHSLTTRSISLSHPTVHMNSLPNVTSYKATAIPLLSHTHTCIIVGFFQILQPTPNPEGQNSKKRTTNPGRRNQNA